VRAILDAAAVVAFLNREPGHEAMTDVLAAGAGICAANVAETIGILMRHGLTAAEAIEAVEGLPVTTFDVDPDLAKRIGALEPPTRRFGLSLGDRCCLALAARERLPALTTDQVWAQAGPLIGVEVRLIR
jgi:ribonuclease VapC